MHELGVVMEVVRTVEEFARDNDVESIETVVLQIGELSSMIPQYVKACYPAAVDGTLLEHAKLEVEILPANARCLDCGTVYNVLDQAGKCQTCGSDRKELLSGKEFFIKEIVCY
ncbi:MAG: hydrogenase maturation nickel metallochaperone HypA [Lachnospiraceae bacterium]